MVIEVIYLACAVGGLCVVINLLLAALPLTIAAVFGMIAVELTCGFVCFQEASVWKSEGACMTILYLLFLVPVFGPVAIAFYVAINTAWCLSLGFICAVLHLVRILIALCFKPSVVWKIGLPKLLLQCCFLLSPFGVLIVSSRAPAAQNKPEAHLLKPGAKSSQQDFVVRITADATTSSGRASSPVEVSVPASGKPAEAKRQVSVVQFGGDDDILPASSTEKATISQPVPMIVIGQASKKDTTIQVTQPKVEAQSDMTVINDNPFQCKCIEWAMRSVLCLGLCLMFLAQIGSEANANFDDELSRIGMCDAIATNPWNLDMSLMDFNDSEQ
jgi:hypothetical protein